ncbi:MAG TPA: hypothetical protein VII52_07655 [Gemmatimonadaceae bacterium]
MRPPRSAARQTRIPSPAGEPDGDSLRQSSERAVLGEIAAWRSRTIPDTAAPLNAEDLVALLRDLTAALELNPGIAAEFTVNTVHYYRRKDIIDPAEGRTAAARYAVHHLWQIAGARLAGHLGLVTLAEARSVIRGADDETLLAFLAARVADARARATMRQVAETAEPDGAARPLPADGAVVASVPERVPELAPAIMIALPGNAWCVIPQAHGARRSCEAAEELVRALGAALRANHPS